VAETVGPFGFFAPLSCFSYRIARATEKSGKDLTRNAAI
jgi:hypothetical protein